VVFTREKTRISERAGIFTVHHFFSASNTNLTLPKMPKSKPCVTTHGKCNKESKDKNKGKTPEMTTADKTTTKGRPRKSQQHQNNNKGKTPNQRTKTKEDPGIEKSKQNNNKGKTPEMTKANKPTKTTRRQHTNIKQLKISSIPCLR
jgi:hypothetical protein